jgi:hypothetical protein
MSTRFNAERGSTARLKIRFEVSGVTLYDPAEITQVEIQREDGTVITTLSGASIVQEAVGIYYVDWGIPLTEALEMHHDKWYYRPETAMPVRSATLDFPVYEAGAVIPVTTILTVAAAHAKGCVDVDTALTDGELQDGIDLIAEIMESFAGRKFAPFAASYTISGTGAGYVFLPEWIRAISSVAVYAVDGSLIQTVDVTNLTWEGRRLSFKTWRPWPAGRCVDSICLNLGDVASVFTSGNNNIVIAGTFGDFGSVPLKASHCCCLFLKYLTQEDTLTGPITANFASEGIQGFSKSLREMYEGVTVKGSTGIAELDQLLNLLRRKRFKCVVPS